MEVQRKLNDISKHLTDPKSWRVIVRTSEGKVVAEISAVIQITSIAALISVSCPEHEVCIIKHNATRRVYRSGRVVSHRENPNLEALTTHSTVEEQMTWKDIS